MKKILRRYLNYNDYQNKPQFLEKYLKDPTLKRLKGIGYFCGMDYASKDIYKFKEYVSRFDHSLSCALFAWKLTHDKKQTLAALYHDIASPCFSHVIDYMNEDYENQESTEEFTEKILENDEYLNKCLKKDDIKLEEISNFKNYSIVDNKRPKLCVDRIDGILLPGIFWSQTITIEDAEDILDSIYIYEDELALNNKLLAELLIETQEKIDILCHANFDNYMMTLLANITKTAINKKYIKYEDLYKLTEKELFNIFENSKDKKLGKLLEEFKNKKLKDIPETKIDNIKVKNINPIINGKRYKEN